jgi:hypothetical protein
MATINKSAAVIQAYGSWVALGGKSHYKKAISEAMPLLAARLASLKISTSKSEVITELKSILKTNLSASLSSRSSSAFDCFCNASHIALSDANAMLGDLIQVTSSMSPDTEVQNEISAIIQRASDLLISQDQSQSGNTDTTKPDPQEIPCTLTSGVWGKITIRFQCPACSHGMKAGEEDIGQTYPCPNCQLPLVIPGTAEQRQLWKASEAAERKAGIERAEKRTGRTRGESKRVVTDSDWDSL